MPIEFFPQKLLELPMLLQQGCAETDQRGAVPPHLVDAPPVSGADGGAARLQQVRRLTVDHHADRLVDDPPPRQVGPAGAHRLALLAEERRGAMPITDENETMGAAVRMHVTEQGGNPRQATLVAFGEAGPLHACHLAAKLRVGRVMVPLRAGVLSALGMPQYDVRGNISMEHRAEAGRALCIWGDAGWGGPVRVGKYQDGRFADNLVDACVGLMRRWDPRPAPEWVTCIPSRRHPNLVPDFAERLAMQLGLPFRRVLEKNEDRAEQKEMANSTQQARNVDGSLVVSEEPLLDGPVLLVDDMVDSRWTLTVAAWLLRSHGSGEVWPFALALTSHGR